MVSHGERAKRERRSIRSTAKSSTQPSRPWTGTPETGSRSSHDGLAIARALTWIEFVDLDVVDVIPAYAPAGHTAFVAPNLAYEMLSLAALSRRG